MARVERQDIPALPPVAGFGRRLLALCVDWAACLAISYGFFGGHQFATLGVFAVENLLLVATAGGTLGHRLAGLRVVREDGAPVVGFARGAGRAALLCLVVPAVVWDGEGRGMHDFAVGTRIVRREPARGA